MAMEADLADPVVPARLFDQAEASLGPVEILVNNASGWLPNTFLPEPAAPWGRIIGLTSGGSGGFAGEVSYGAAKAAQESYTMSAARELGPYGVSANLVHPPVTDTGWLTPEVAATAAAASPLRHIAQPAEVAELIVLLASHQARFVTGQLIRMA